MRILEVGFILQSRCVKIAAASKNFSSEGVTARF